MGAAGLAVCLLVAVGCGRSEAGAGGAAALPGIDPEAPHPVAVLEVEDLGEIRIELYPEAAPRTVENFVELAESGFYDGTTFHRVVPGFVIQGGDPNSRDRDPRNDGQGGPGWKIPDEPNAIRHERGAVAMAKAGPNTAGSQFFVVVETSPHLDGHFTVFGRVVAGLDVVDRIASVETDRYGRWGAPDRPLEDVVVRRVRIEPPSPRTAEATPSPAANEDSAAGGGV